MKRRLIILLAGLFCSYSLLMTMIIYAETEPPLIDDAGDITEPETESHSITEVTDSETEADEEDQDSPETDESDNVNTAITETIESSEELTTQAGETDLESNQAIVENIADLKMHLTTNNGVNHIYLGADMSLPAGGISVISSKGDFIIDGTDPRTGIRHTLRDYNSATQADSINIDGTSHTSKNVILENINLEGLNYFGPVSFYDNASVNSTLTIRNVRYSGPQLCVIRFGTVTLDNCDIEIKSSPVSAANEVAESAQVIFQNKVRINQTSANVNAIFLTRMSADGVRPAVIVNAGADVIVNTFSGNNGSNFVYDESNNLQIIFNEQSSVVYNGQDSFWRNLPIKEIIVKKGAVVKIYSTNQLSRILLRIDGNVSIEDGAVFIVFNQTATSNYAFYLNGGTLTLNNPKQVLFANQSGIAMAWNNNSNILEAATTQVNYWKYYSGGGLSAASAANYSWSKEPDEPLVLSGSGAVSNGLRILTSNYTAQEPDPPSHILDNKAYHPLDTSTFELAAAQVISFGQRPKLSAYHDKINSQMEGRSEPYSDILVQRYDEIDDVYIDIGSGKADSSGFYEIPIVLPENADELRVVSHYQYLYSSRITSIERQLTLTVPEQIYLEPGNITGKWETVLRAESSKELEVEIFDARAKETSWQFYVRAESLTAHDPEGIYDDENLDIRGSLYFIGEDGSKAELGAQLHLIDSSDTGGEKIYRWGEEQGVIAEVDTRTVRAGISYTAQLIWILSDVP